MLDLFGIVVSGLLMIFVVLRAVQLDRSRPWFERPGAAQDAPNAPRANGAMHRPQTQTGQRGRWQARS